MLGRIVMPLLLLGNAVASETKDSAPQIASAVTTIERTIRPGERITVATTDQRSIKGRYMYISRLDTALFLSFKRVTETTDTSISLPRVQKITYKRSGRPQLAYVIGGLVLGTGLGHFAERVIFDPGASPGIFHKYTSRGSFWGGLSGVVLGTVISSAIPSSRTLDLSRH
ncbi:MAG: hypothetical protein AB1644_05550 [Candidatus Zixiibacteriota bacterium]